MPLPEKIKMKALLFADGPGMKLQAFENQELGVRLDTLKEKGKWSDTWSHKMLPGQGFPTYSDLRNAYARMEEERT